MSDVSLFPFPDSTCYYCVTMHLVLLWWSGIKKRMNEQFEYWLYFHSRIMALFHYCDTAMVKNQHQLQTCQTSSKWQSLLFKKNYYFRIFIKNLTKCNVFSTFAPKSYGKFIEHNIEKLCPLPLASAVSVLGLERVCPRKVGPWPQIFFEFLALNVVSSTPSLVKSNKMLPMTRYHCNISSKGAALPGRNEGEMGLANSLHASRNATSIMKDLYELQYTVCLNKLCQYM